MTFNHFPVIKLSQTMEASCSELLQWFEWLLLPQQTARVTGDDNNNQSNKKNNYHSPGQACIHSSSHSAEKLVESKQKLPEVRENPINFWDLEEPKKPNLHNKITQNLNDYFFAKKDLEQASAESLEICFTTTKSGENLFNFHVKLQCWEDKKFVEFGLKKTWTTRHEDHRPQQQRFQTDSDQYKKMMKMSRQIRVKCKKTCFPIRNGLFTRMKSTWIAPKKEETSYKHLFTKQCSKLTQVNNFKISSETGSIHKSSKKNQEKLTEKQESRNLQVDFAAAESNTKTPSSQAKHIFALQCRMNERTNANKNREKRPKLAAAEACFLCAVSVQPLGLIEQHQEHPLPSELFTILEGKRCVKQRIAAAETPRSSSQVMRSTGSNGNSVQ